MVQDPKTIARFEKGFIHTPDKAAKTIINGIKKKQDRILIGPETHVSDAIVRLAPAKYTNLFDRIIIKRLFQIN